MIIFGVGLTLFYPFYNTQALKVNKLTFFIMQISQLTKLLFGMAWQSTKNTVYLNSGFFADS